MYFNICSLIILLINAIVCQAQTSPFEDIKKAYSQINTMEARFNQRLFISSLKKERGFEGEFYYKRGKGFLWQYKTPKAKYFLYDGRYIYQGEEDKPFIMKDRINKDKTGGTFLDLIEDIAKLDELFILKQQSISENMDMLILVPKKDSTIKSARVWIDKNSKVKKLELLEFTGNTNTIEFSSIRTNQNISDGKFIFKPDKTKEIIER